jgi:uncharacterized protein YndB with AHSA1/START domain
MLKRVGIVLVALCALLAVAVVGLFLASRRRDAGVNDVTLEIKRPPAQVFPWLTEGDRARQWIGGLEQIEPLTEGPLRVGLKERAVVVLGSERMTLEMEVVGFEEGRRIRYQVTGLDRPSIGFTEIVDFSVEPSETGTRFRAFGRMRYHRRLLRLFEPLMTRRAQRKFQEDAQRLKTLVEAEPAEAGAPPP